METDFHCTKKKAMIKDPPERRAPECMSTKGMTKIAVSRARFSFEQWLH